mmetsp:Transcript_26910/g.82814  ORF Transcript_26910/g.82814 Transcript_26910/m.82814 type:complete len:215 (-) Transcript_26910:894-1538(-)
MWRRNMKAHDSQMNGRPQQPARHMRRAISSSSRPSTGRHPCSGFSFLRGSGRAQISAAAASCAAATAATSASHGATSSGETAFDSSSPSPRGATRAVRGISCRRSRPRAAAGTGAAALGDRSLVSLVFCTNQLPATACARSPAHPARGPSRAVLRGESLCTALVLADRARQLAPRRPCGPAPCVRAPPRRRSQAPPRRRSQQPRAARCPFSRCR